MKVEIRNNSVILDGYVNVAQRDSRQLMSQRGKFVEQIMPNTFKDALQKTDNVDMLFNHNENRKLGSTKDGNLMLREDVIGLRATATVTDPEVVNKAKAGELRGWSFGFVATEERWSDGDNGVQRRYLSGLELREVSILDITPAYFATTVETRGEGAVIELERRAEEFDFELNDIDGDEGALEETPDGENEDETNEDDQEEPDYSLLDLEIEALKLKGGF